MMTLSQTRSQTIGVIGGGLVGLGWAIVFARSGQSVRLFDAESEIRQAVPARLRAGLEDMARHGLVDHVDEIAKRVVVVESLPEAVGDADYIQESVFERVDIKQEVSRAIGAAMRADAVVGSSSSGIPASAFTQDVARRERFLIAHPVNPPHLVPLVELVPAPWTDPDIVPWLHSEMERFGQMPIVVRREIEGFVLNRLQGALLNEAWALYEAGIASAEDIDRTVAHGLGLRWSFMGPFETIDLNAPGGIADYARRLGPLYHSIAQSRTKPQAWSDTLIEKIEGERRQILSAESLHERSAWRDRRLMTLVGHRRGQPDR
jgi:L-gulonate 3-dehydrogenase